jgi:hypothetical protein
VTADDDTALEAEHHVLSHRIHTLQHPPVDSACDTRRQATRIGALGFHALADQNLEAPRDAMQGVTLGHRSLAEAVVELL